jgi:hypothetical protein
MGAGGRPSHRPPDPLEPGEGWGPSTSPVFPGSLHVSEHPRPPNPRWAVGPSIQPSRVVHLGGGVGDEDEAPSSEVEEGSRHLEPKGSR